MDADPLAGLRAKVVRTQWLDAEEALELSEEGSHTAFFVEVSTDRVAWQARSAC